MTNKNKFSKFIHSLTYYRSVIPKKNLKYFDVISTLYQERKIEKQSEVEKLLKKLAGRGKAPQSAIKLIENKYMNQEPVIGIKSPLKPFHMTAKIEQRLHYNNKYSKQGGYKADEVKDKHKDRLTMIQDSRVIMAKDINMAQKKFKDIIYDKYGTSTESTEKNKSKKEEYDEMDEEDKGSAQETSDGYVQTNVDDIEFIDSVDESSLVSTSPTTMYLKSASAINYNFTNEEVKFLKDTNHCVEDNLLGIYKDQIKKFTFDKLISLATTFYKSKDIDWNNDMGYTPECILYICQYFKISMYAYDIMRNCFLKYVVENLNYDALYFYAINNHMYLVKDAYECNSLREKAKSNKTFNTSLIEKDEKKKKPFSTLPIHENIDISTLFKNESGIFIYSREGYSNINDIFKTCLELYGIPLSESIKASKTNITQFTYMNKKKMYIIAHDPNDLRTINWKRIQKLCIDNKVEFLNQTFPSFIRQYKSLFLNKASERIEFTPEERKVISDEYKNTCNLCNQECKTDFEIDHIIPLTSNIGSNEKSNLQILCKSCHKIKSQNEKEDGSYIKINPTESSCNNQVLEVMNDGLSSRYAFVEHLLPLDINLNYDDDDKEGYYDEDGISYESQGLYRYGSKTKDDDEENFNYSKVFNIDINKCRKNILYHTEYDFPCFNVMDRVVRYNKDIHNKTGIYYVETQQYFPMHGNGWYSLPMIDYCLKLGLITHTNIKYTIQSILAIPNNYFVEFIDLCYSTLPIDLQKLSINSMIGGFKPNLDKHIKWISICITGNSCEAYRQYLENKGCFIEVIHIKDKKYFHVYKEIQSTNLESEKPIYDQILDLEAIELHKLANIIESEKGIVLDLNTDCISCYFRNDIFPFDLNSDGKNINNFKHDNGDLKYKLEEKNTRLQIERNAKFIRKNIYLYEPDKWNIYEDVEDNDFKPLVDKLINLNKSCFITGSAGTGKSELIRQTKLRLDEEGKTYKCLAPTNLAAININGTTIHKFVSKVKKNGNYI